MGKKIYAIKQDCESFDCNAYYDDEMAAEDMIGTISGRSGAFEVNEDLKNDVIKALDNAGYDAEVIEDKEDMSAEDKAEEHKSNIRYYFEGLKSKNVELTAENIAKLNDYALDYYRHGFKPDEEEKVLCDVLGMLHGKKFVTRTLRGCGQSDWVDVVLPEDRLGMIDYVEAVWMGTGTEYKVACIDEVVREEDESDEEYIDRISEAMDVDAYFDYTDKWRDEDIKEWLLGNCHGVNLTKDDVVLIDIESSYRVTHYNYKIV